jgi:membrane associated rhomboid family serine protease
MFLPVPTRLEGAPGGVVPPRANSLLIATNVLLYFLGFSWHWGVQAGGSPLAIITHAFVHANAWHLLGNMWILWVFGNAVNRRVGDSLYLVSYLAVAAAVGLTAWFLSDGLLVGSSGAIFGVVAMATMLLAGTKTSVYYIAMLPVTVLIGLLRRPNHWLQWLLRWDHFAFPTLYAIVIVPAIELWGLWCWHLSGHLSWTNLAHLLGFVFGIGVVLLLPPGVSLKPAAATG